MTLPPGWTRTDGTASVPYVRLTGPTLALTVHAGGLRFTDRTRHKSFAPAEVDELVQVLEHARALHGELFPEAAS